MAAHLSAETDAGRAVREQREVTLRRLEPRVQLARAHHGASPRARGSGAEPRHGPPLAAQSAPQPLRVHCRARQSSEVEGAGALAHGRALGASADASVCPSLLGSR